MAQLITEKPGGAGCVREAVETMLKGAGLWSQIMARYMKDDVPS